MCNDLFLLPFSLAANARSIGARHKKALLLALLSPLLSACQTAPPVHPDQAENFRQIDLFLALNQLRISGLASDLREESIIDWGRLNDQAVILAVGSDRRVLVTLREPCENLARARAIGFERALTFVVPDPLGNGFDIRESFGQYLTPGDDLILAYSKEELETIKWQVDGPGFGQLGECTASQLYYLESFEAEADAEDISGL